MQDAKKIRYLLENNTYNEQIYSGLFSILAKNYSEYSKNKSGVFFDLRKILPEDLTKAKDYLESINATSKNHEESYENILNKYSSLKCASKAKSKQKPKPKVIQTKVNIESDTEEEDEDDIELFGHCSSESDSD